MIFIYKALDSKGEEIIDTIDAPNESAARQKIRKSGLYPVKISEKGKNLKTGSGISSLKHYAESLNEFINRNSAKKQVGLFSRQMSQL